MSSIMKGMVDETELDENLHKWFKEKWVRFGPDGKIRGACARGDDSEGKPKCLPQKKAQNLGKKGRKYAASKKRREDPNPERTGKAKNVATKKKTNEDVPFNECPQCRGPIVHESMMNEKQDACYHKVKSRYKVWPSAYASGALVQCRKKGASNWGTGGKKNEDAVMKGMVDEAKAKPYVKPYNDPKTGEQLGWVSSDGYHKKYWQKFAKDSAIKHAKLNPDEVQEDYTGEFAAEKTPAINPYGGLKDKQHRGAISEEPTTSGPVGTQPGGWREYKPKPAGEIDEDTAYAGGMGQGHSGESYRKFKPKSAGTFKEEKKPDFMKAGNMKPFNVSGEEIPGAVHSLEKALIKAKEKGMKLNYENIDKIMQAICKKHNLTGDDLHNQFVDKHHMIPDNWIVKQLDEACWKGYHKEGNKKMFGKTYPNCVKNKKSNEDVTEEQLDEKCWDTHKQVGMKNKGGKQVPNCVPKESAILKGIKNRLI
jgi:hypothetical protein